MKNHRFDNYIKMKNFISSRHTRIITVEKRNHEWGEGKVSNTYKEVLKFNNKKKKTLFFKKKNRQKIQVSTSVKKMPSLYKSDWRDFQCHIIIILQIRTTPSYQ